MNNKNNYVVIIFYCFLGYSVASTVNNLSVAMAMLFEPRRKKTGLRGFRPGLTPNGLYSQRSKLEA